MALVINGNNYAGLLDETVTTRLINNRTLLKLGARRVNGVKGKYVLNNQDTTVTLEAGSPNAPTLRNINHRHSTHEVCWVMGGVGYDKTALSQDYWSVYLQAGVKNEDILQVQQVREAFIADTLARVMQEVDRQAWGIAYADAVTLGCPSWGLIRKIEANSAASDPIRQTIVQTGAAVDATNVIAQMQAAYAGLPNPNIFNEGVAAGDRPEFFIAPNVMKALQAAVVGSNGTQGTWGFNPITGMWEMSFYGYKVNVLQNMADSSILFTAPKNLLVAVDREQELMDLYIVDKSLTTTELKVEVRYDVRIDYNYDKGAELVYRRP